MKLTREGFLTAILVVAALFVGSFVVERMPTPDALLGGRPFLQETPIGDPVELRTAEVTVVEVQPAKRVELFGQVSEAAGIWLVAEIVWAPIASPSSLGGAFVALETTDGRTFGDAQTVNNTCGPTQPGLAVACQIAIEVDPDALADAQLLVPAETSVRAADDVARIDPGIDRATVERWTESDEQIALLESTAATS
ncbi:hypothetical protein [Microbacterium sp. gxy059]|uniref:hypothetical protein n=1 Tax=Microbacterium sp. gxy059 TaxID=2957199 RepID=UPI003D98EE74